MKTVASIIISSFAAFLFSPSAVAAAYLIDDVSVVNPDQDGRTEVQDVLVNNGKIEKIAGKIIPQENDVVISGKGKYLLPGLIDTHVHLKVVPGMAIGQEDQFPAIAKDYYQQLPKSYLYYGFTGVIDLAIIDPAFMKKFRDEKIRPDVWDCGGALPIAEGYPMMFLPKEKRYEKMTNFLYDERYSNQIPKKYKRNDHTPAAAVRRVKESGGICVKTFLESGWGDNQWPQIQPEMMAELLKEAHKNGLPVFVHANAYKDYKRIVSDKVDIVAHGMWNWGKYQREKGTPQEIKSVLDDLIKNGTYYVPTMRVIVGIGSVFDEKFLKDPNLKHVVPISLLNWYDTKEGKGFQRELLEENPDHQDFSKALENFSVISKNGQKALAYLYSKGGKIVFGTDTPSSPTWGNPPGYNGFLEMKLMEEAGMKPKDILASATSRAAEMLGLEKDVGSIQVGKRANLLLLAKDPLKGVGAFESIETVFVHGDPIDRRQLSALSHK